MTKIKHINKIRYFVQTLVVLFILIVPILSLYQSKVSAYAIQWMQGSEKVFFETIDNVVRLILDDPKNDLDMVKGSVWSAQIGTLKISDPLAVVGQVTSEKHFYWPFILTALIPFGITLLFGRIFCGWICPGYLLYEIGDIFRQLLNRAGIKPRNIKLSPLTKYIVLVLGVIIGFVLGGMVFPMIYPPAIISREWYYLVYTGSFGSGITLLLISLFIEISVSRRAVCRYLCPGGALYSLLGKFRVIRIRRKPSVCTSCIKCNDVCGLGLKPMQDLTGMDCNTCGACIAACPTDALTIRLGWSDSPLRPLEPNKSKEKRVNGEVSY